MNLKKAIFVSTALTLTALGIAIAQQGRPPAGMTLTSSGYEDGSAIPNKYTQAVPNPVSPPLAWTNVPENTVSFTLIMHDLDVAARKSTTDSLHWIAVNIPGTATSLPEGVPAGAQLPDGTIQLKTQRNVNGFIGPGPPAGSPYHHYVIELYAVDTKLDLTPDATRADLLKALDGHVLAKGVLVGRFRR